uniref:Uncharacterized protein n=1 Tax=Anopheles culicifacies TaxID=139723 RepID=A0A182MHA4_9DIPT
MLPFFHAPPPEAACGDGVYLNSNLANYIAICKTSLDFALFSHGHLLTPSVSRRFFSLAEQNRFPERRSPRRQPPPGNPPSPRLPRNQKPNLDDGPSSRDYLLPLHACLGF